MNLYISFFAASLALAIMPGPDNLFVLAESLAKGAKRGILITAGLCLGICMHTALCATGISLVISQTPSLYVCLQFLGACYLAILAFEASRETPKAAEVKTDTKSENMLKTLLRGFLMNALNPKVALFFLALMPQFIREGDISIPVQFVILGGIFMLSVLVVFNAISLLASKFANLIKSFKFLLIMKWVRVILFSSISFAMLAESVKIIS